MRDTRFTSDLFERSNLTKAQLAIWTGQQLSPNVPLYNMALTFTIEGPLDPEIFRRAFRLLVARCDALRTIVEEVDGLPQQRVLSEIDDALEYVDFSTQPEPRTAMRLWAQERCQRSFELDHCLFDTALAKLSEGEYAWYFNQHHLVTDAWSFALMYRQLEQYYSGLVQGTLEEPPALLGYQSYVAYEREARGSDRDGSPQKRPSPSAILPPRPYGKSGSEGSTRTERVHWDLGAERSEKLRRLAQEKDVRSLTSHLSLFNLFATLVFAYLYRISGQRSLSIGAPAHNRPTRDFKETIGLFIEVLPLEVEVEEEDSFLSLLKKVQAATGAFLRLAQPGATDPNDNRRFNVLLNYINASFGDFCGLKMRSEWLHPGHGDRGHYLRLQVHDFDAADRFLLHFDFSCDVFDPDLRSTAVDHFSRLVDALIADRNQPIENVDLLTRQERADLVDAFNQTQAAGSTAPTVVDGFESQVADTPEATALVYGDRRYTYRCLNARANQLARLLRQRGVAPGTLVGICMKRSPEAVLAMMGVLKAGGAYVPIDPFYPEDRIAFMLDDSRAQVLLTHSAVAERLPNWPNTLCVDSLEDRLAQERDENLEHVAGTEDVAYVIYTSGSTGRPKGVMIPHRALMHYAHWAKTRYAGPRKLAFPLFSPLSFDLTVTSIFVPLLSGGRIVVYPESDSGPDLALLDVVRDDCVDLIKLTPSHLALLQENDLTDSRVGQLILGGEDLRRELAQNMVDKFGGGVEIHNEYGPTEATVGCILHTFDPAWDTGTSVPIGRPIDNMQAYVLNSHLQPVPRGVVGELFLAGEGLAKGYWNRPELTSQRFLSNPFRSGTTLYRTGDLARVGESGALEYLGRRDHQVKIRGARIELGEIEAALSEHPKIEACVVNVVRRDPPSSDGEVRHCVRCSLPSNYPGTTFDRDQVCHFCQAFDSYRSKVGQYFKGRDDLRAIFEKSKATNQSQYDCIALLSGGKDSTYALCQLVEMGLRVLAFTLDNGYISDQAKANVERVVESLGVDHVFGSTPAMNEIFVDSLRRHANVCNGCFKTIYTLSLNLAKQKGIPYIVTGLSRGQFFETRLTEELFTGPSPDVDRIDQQILEARKAYHRLDDAVSRLLDVAIFQDDRIFEEVRFLDFYRYCSVPLDEMLAYLNERVPWIRPSDTGRSTNCLINDVGIHIHQRERGYHNYAFPYSWDVRMGHKTREAALAELNDEIDLKHVHGILRDIGYGDSGAEYGSSQSLVAYYVSADDLKASDLKSHLGSKLPDFMMPSHFVRLEAVPLTPNGKVDRDALPAPDLVRSASEVDYVAPGTEVEESLVRIWSDVLRVERVGIRDNFFDLGGDSIMAIQIIARANRAGLRLIPSQLFDHQTVEQLATVAESRAATQADQGRVTGAVPLTPVQRWFFAMDLPDPGHWNQVLAVTVPSDANVALLDASFRHLLEHHDALRMRFSKRRGQWQAFLPDEIPPFALSVVECSKLSAEQRQEKLEAVGEDLHANLDLAAGRLVRGALFRDADQPGQLLIVIHHLVVDAVSWPILLEDLATVYEQLQGGKPAALPPKTASFQQWSKGLASYAESEVLQGELEGWRESLATPVAELPAEGGGDPPNNEGSADTVSVWLGAEETQSLLHVPQAYRMQVHEVLLTAVCRTLSQWAGGTTLRIDLEGHGRESIAEDLDVSRTVGWFTSIFPLTLSLPKDPDPAPTLRAIKDRVRGIPNRGVGYGVLRYLSSEDRMGQELSAFQPAQVLFNYLGRAEQLVPEEPLFQFCRPLELSRSPRGTRTHLLEINATLVDDRLRIDWTFGKHRHRRSTVEGLAKGSLSVLATLIDHCLHSEPTGFTAGDFPLANLDDKKLEKLSALLEKTDKARGSAP